MMPRTRAALLLGGALIIAWGVHRAVTDQAGINGDGAKHPSTLADDAPAREPDSVPSVSVPPASFSPPASPGEASLSPRASTPSSRPSAEPTPGPATQPPPTASLPPVIAGGQPSMPVRAAFYYPWFPETWHDPEDPFTRFLPSLGSYHSGDRTVVATHIEAMKHGHIEVGIASWWGRASISDGRLPLLLATAADRAFWWTIYYEEEGSTDPSAEQIAADLNYVAQSYSAHPQFFRIDGRFVVFVYADGQDGCEMVDRWVDANQDQNAYIVLKVFSGYRNCPNQPNSWHQYAPARAADQQVGYSYTISPGFFKADEGAPRLARDLDGWSQTIRDMIASGAPFQLITTFNEWGEGTAVESAAEWPSASGYGLYLDALHRNGQPP